MARAFDGRGLGCWAVFGLAVGSGLGLTACGQLIGADDYATAEPALPYHGFFDSLGGPACRECVLSGCQGTLEQCSADPVCGAQLDCMTTNPGMKLACKGAGAPEYISTGAAVASCLQQCSAPCGTGRVWSCAKVANVSPPASDQTEAKCFVRYVDAVSGTGLSGLDVRACALTDPSCESPRSSPAPLTDKNGETQFTVTWPPPSPVSPPGFDGYLELTRPSNQPSWRPILRFTGNRIVTDWVDAAVMPNTADPIVQKLVYLATGIQVDLTASGISVEVHDCLGSPAPGVRFEVTVEPGSVPVELVYLDEQGNLDPSLSQTTKTGLAFGINVWGEAGKAVARFAEGGEVIRERSFVLRPGAASAVTFEPAPLGE